jgi:L-lactate dehydrogenase complex protein LldF
MLGEEIGLPEALAQAGIERVETDLAEHIIQLADERPSHIVIPALHKTQEEIAHLFTEKHARPRESEAVEALVESARHELRPKYVAADVVISGANFLAADSGTVVIVTNEGNAELTTALPPLLSLQLQFTIPLPFNFAHAAATNSHRAGNLWRPPVQIGPPGQIHRHVRATYRRYVAVAATVTTDRARRRA